MGKSITLFFSVIILKDYKFKRREHVNVRVKKSIDLAEGYTRII